MRRSLPSPQVDSRSGRSSGCVALERLGEGDAAGRRARRTEAQDRREPDRALRPPVAEQLGVDREGDQARACRAARERPRSRCGHGVGELAGVALGARAAPPRGRTGPRRSPRGAFPPSTAGGTRRRRDRTDSRARDQTSSTASQSSVKATSPAAARTGASASSGALVGALVGAEEPQAALGQQRLDSGPVGALGKPEALGGAEPAPVRAKPGVDLQAPAGGGGDQRQHRVAWPRRACSATFRSAAARAGTPRARRRRGPRGGPARDGSAPPPPRAAGRSSGGGLARVALGRLEPVAAQERLHALRHPGRLELVGEHRGHGDASGRAPARARAGRSGPPRRTATPRRTGRSRSPRRRACASAGRSRDRRPARSAAQAWQTARKSRRPSRSPSAVTSKSEDEIAGTKRS